MYTSPENLGYLLPTTKMRRCLNGAEKFDLSKTQIKFLGGEVSRRLGYDRPQLLDLYDDALRRLDRRVGEELRVVYRGELRREVVRLADELHDLVRERLRLGVRRRLRRLDGGRHGGGYRRRDQRMLYVGLVLCLRHGGVCGYGYSSIDYWTCVP